MLTYKILSNPDNPIEVNFIKSWIPITWGMLNIEEANPEMNLEIDIQNHIAFITIS